MHRIFRIAALVALSTTYTAAISQITDAQASTIAAATAQSFKASGPIEQVEVRRAEKTNFTYAIWYKGSPTLAQITNDTTNLVRVTLKKLKADGINTASTPVFIHAHAYRKEKGETRDMVRVYGKASYNFNTDSINFKLEK